MVNQVLPSQRTHDLADGPRPASLAAAGLAGVTAAVTGAATVMALDFPDKAAVAPLAVGLPTTVLALIVLLREVRLLLRGRGQRAGRPAWAWAGHGIEAVRPNPYLWLLLYACLFYLGGAVVALAAFSIGLIRFRGGQAWAPTLWFTALTTLAFYLLVEVALGEPLHRGLLLG